MKQVGGAQAAAGPKPLLVAAALLCFALAAVAQTYVARPQLLGQGKWLFVVCMVAAWWVLGRDKPETTADVAPQPVRFRRMARPLLCAAAVDVVAAVYATRTATAGDAFVLWLIALCAAGAVLFVNLVVPHLASMRRMAGQRTVAPGRLLALVALIVIILVGSYLRLDGMADLFPLVVIDEGNCGLQAERMANGTYPNVFATGTGGLPSLCMGPTALMMKFWPPDLTTLRVSVALVDILILPCLYVLARLFLNIPFSLLVTGLLAFAQSNIYLSRYGVIDSQFGLCSVLFLFFLIRAVKRRSVGDALACGVVGGFAIYSYHANRSLGILALTVMLFMAVSDRKRWTLYLRLGLVVLVTAVFVGAPQLGYYLSRPGEILGYSTAHLWLTDVGLRNSLGGDSALPRLAAQMVDRAFWGFNAYNDTTWHYGGRLLDPVTGLLYMLGLAVCVRRAKDAAYFALIAMLVICAVFFGALVKTPPNLLRMNGVIPLLCLMAGLALHAIWSMVARLGRAQRVGSAVGIFIVVPVAVLWLNYDWFFNHWVPEKGFEDPHGSIALYLRDNDVTPFAVHADFSPNDAQFRFVAPGKQGYMMVAWQDYLPVRQPLERDAAFIAYGQTLPAVSLIEDYYPGGDLATVYSPAGKLMFASYRVSADSLRAEQGVRGRYRELASGLSTERRDSVIDFEWPAGRPAGFSGDVAATWDGSLFVPEYGWWRLRLEGSGSAALVIDGAAVASKGPGAADAEGRVLLAQGWHVLHLEQRAAAGMLKLLWALDDRQMQVIGQEYLGARTTVNGLRAAYFAGPEAAGTPTIVAIEPAIFNRVNAYTAKFGSQPCAVLWSGVVDAPADGAYRFAARAISGDFELKIDGKSILAISTGMHDRREAGVDLAAGVHTITIRLISPRGQTEALEVFWAPPGSSDLTPLPASVLQPSQE